DWKLVVRKGVPALYNLETDLHEDHNVAAQHPEIVAKMVDIIKKEHTESNLFKVTLP
ncbi:MAG: arylsulfatase, partial [Prevotella shahii]|nr:arylsulfatase [Hoylesella shahii]